MSEENEANEVDDPTEVEGESPFKNGINPDEGLQGWDEGRSEEVGRQLMPKGRYNGTITKASIVINDEKPYMRQLNVQVNLEGQKLPLSMMFFLCNKSLMKKALQEGNSHIKAGTPDWAERHEMEELNVLLVALELKPTLDVKKAIFLDGDTDILLNIPFSARVYHEKDEEYGDRERINTRSIQRAK